MKENSDFNLMGYFSEIIKKGLIYSSVSIFQQLLNFILIPIYTLFLTPQDFGIIAIMTTTAGLILVFTKTPLAYGFVRFYYSLEFSHLQKKLYFNSVINVCLRAFLPSILFFIFSDGLSTLLLGNDNFRLVIIIYSFIIFFQPLEDMSQDLLKIQKKANHLALLQIINIVLSSVLIIYCFYSNLGLYSLIYGLLFSTLFPVFILLPIMVKNMEFIFDFKLLKPIFRYGNPFIILLLSQFLLNNIDFYFIRTFLNLNDVGIYSFATKFGALLGAFVVFPIRFIFEPIIFQLDNDKVKQRQLLLSFTKTFFIFCIFLYSFLSIFSKEIVMIFSSSKDFYPAWTLIPFIAFAFICIGMMDYFGKGLEIEKKSKIISFLYLSGAITNIILNLVFIQFFGLFGIILSKLISLFLIISLCYYYSKKYYKLELPILIFSIISAGILIFNIMIIFLDGIFSLIEIRCIFFLLFSIFLFVFLKSWLRFKFKELLNK